MRTDTERLDAIQNGRVILRPISGGWEARHVLAPQFQIRSWFAHDDVRRCIDRALAWGENRLGARTRNATRETA